MMEIFDACLILNVTSCALLRFPSAQAVLDHNFRGVKFISPSDLILIDLTFDDDMFLSLSNLQRFSRRRSLFDLDRNRDLCPMAYPLQTLKLCKITIDHDIAQQIHPN